MQTSQPTIEHYTDSSSLPAQTFSISNNNLILMDKKYRLKNRVNKNIRVQEAGKQQGHVTYT